MPQSLLLFSQKHTHIIQFARYVTVGAIMLIINIILVWFFVQLWGMHYLVGCSIAFVIESLFAFFANRHWTFRSSTDFKSGYIRFLTIAFYSFIVILFLTYGLVHFLAFKYLWARTVSSVITGFIGYFLDLKVTFRV